MFRQKRLRPETAICEKAKTRLILPELYANRVIEHNFNVMHSDLGYDVIIGSDLMTELGLNIQFSTQELEWDEASIPFKSKDVTLETSYFLADSQAVQESVERIRGILDAKYEAADLLELCEKSNPSWRTRATSSVSSLKMPRIIIRRYAWSLHQQSIHHWHYIWRWTRNSHNKYTRNDASPRSRTSAQD